MVQDTISDLDIAIIGMACRFPGASTPDAFWRNLADGVETLRHFTDTELTEAGVGRNLLDAPNYVKAAHVLDDVERFDASFFGYSPREAAMLDPQSRLFLYCAWEAFEDAGYGGPNRTDSVSVYAAQSLNTYLLRNLRDQVMGDEFILSSRNIQAVLTNSNDFIASRVSYKLNLTGPAFNVQSACSSSLVALHLACQSLLNGECDMALAGGASVYLPQIQGYLYEEGMILSPDGHCRPFDVDAGGTVFSRGAGAVLLKPLTDAVRDHDVIHAVIKGSAVNNDGAARIGFTAPSVQGQSRVITEALASAGVERDDISYIECHGTGTAQGDQIEITALKEVFGNESAGDTPCFIGSVKSNIGHADAAAGMAGLLKTVLMLRHRSLVPTLHFKAPNPLLKLDASPFRVNDRLRSWETDRLPRRAGVSSFGMGGANAHIVLEEAPSLPQKTDGGERPAYLLPLAAHSDEQLSALASDYADTLEHLPAHLADICYTASVGRQHTGVRAAFAAGSIDAFHEMLTSFAETSPARPASSHGRRKIAFICTGQGSQYPGMARQLYETEPVFREHIDTCARLLESFLDRPLTTLLFESDRDILDQTAYTQPVLFALEYALARLWQSWGIQPDAVMGHSVGEYAAAAIAGVFSLEDAIRLIAHRGRLMGGLPSGGGMAVVFADERTVRDMLGNSASTVTVAALNSPSNTVISGTLAALDDVCDAFKEKGIRTRRLATSHAFHSPLMDPILDEFEQLAETVSFSEPAIPVISNVTGAFADSGIASARYWRTHIAEPVRFAESMATLAHKGYDVFLEIGPAPILLGMARQCIDDGNVHWVPSLKSGAGDSAMLMESMGALYRAGVDIDWQELYRYETRARVPLPTYPFRGDRHWFDPPAATTHAPTPVWHAPTGTSLTGERLDTAFPVYEYRLNPSQDRWLEDHDVFGRILFPAVGYLTLAGDVAAELISGSPYRLANVTFDHALTIPREGIVRLQMTCVPDGTGGFRYTFQNRETGVEGEHNWTTCAGGHLISAGAAITADVTLADLQGRDWTEVSVPPLYERLHAGGLWFGASFRGIERLWHDDGASFGMIRYAIPGDGCADTFTFHPALLDACLQVVLAGVFDRMPDNTVYVPVRIESFVRHGAPGDVCWSHARIHDGYPMTGPAPERIVSDVTVFADDGAVIAAIIGLELRRVSSTLLYPEASIPVDDLLYRIRWISAPLVTDVMSADDLDVIAEHGVRAYADLAGQYDLDMYSRREPLFAALCRAYLVRAFADLGHPLIQGEQLNAATLLAELGVLPQYTRLLRRFLEILAGDGVLAVAADGYMVAAAPEPVEPETLLEQLHAQFPAGAAEYDYVARTGPHLARVLSGEEDPLRLLFADGNLAASRRLYTETPFAKVYNMLAGEIVAQIAASHDRAQPLRILEIGAGTGGTTSFVLPRLDPGRTRYVFTDLSRLFLTQAQQAHGAAYPFVEYDILDIEQDPTAQGYEPGGFDVILAANVVHATCDLAITLDHIRTLLAPGGILLLLEVTAPQRFADLTVGLTDGWWRFADTDRRPSYALLDQQRWTALLADAGFDSITAIPGNDHQVGIMSEQTVLFARSSGRLPRIADGASGGRRCLILGGTGGIGKALEQALTAMGWQCDGYAGDESPAYGTILDRYRNEGDPLHTIIDLSPLDAPDIDAESPESVRRVQRTLCGNMLSLVQTLALTGDTPEIVLVSRGTQHPDHARTGAQVDASTLWGFVPVIQREYPQIACTCIDLDPFVTDNAETTAMLAAEIGADSPNRRIAYRNGERLTARYEQFDPAQTDSLPKEPYRLMLPDSHLLDDLAFKPFAPVAPGSGEVLIAVQATGLNFKDVMLALGIYPEDPIPPGFECAGIVESVGEGVTGLAPGDRVVAIGEDCFASRACVDASMVVKKPDNLGFEQAAAVFSNYLTAWYSLVTVGGLKAGETVLIHSAAGGVGIAAVRIAHTIGAQVYATAGTARKRSFLESLGVQRAMDSRCTEFAGEIRECLGARSIDLVLNSLTGDALRASLGLLGTQGRFIELGKTDILGDDEQTALPDGISYNVIDVGARTTTHPAEMRELLVLLRDAFADGTYPPHPLTIYPCEDIAEAFACMRDARHIGKIVVSQVKPFASGTFPADASCLITGGMGGIGMQCAEWAAAHGMRHLVLMGRHQPSAEVQARIDALIEEGVTVTIARGDVADCDAVQRILDDIRETHPPLRGIFHCAGLLSDGVLSGQDWDGFETVFAPKVYGGFNLHTLTRDLDLDWFVLFSSIASIITPTAQANHAAACAYLDALAQYRRSQGLPAISVNWGPWAEIGAATGTAALKQIQAQGMTPISPDAGIAAFERVLGLNPVQTGVVSMDWDRFAGHFTDGAVPPLFASLAEPKHETADTVTADAELTIETLYTMTPKRRSAMLLDHVAMVVKRSLGIDTGMQVGTDRPLSELGLDSLLAIEVRNRLAESLPFPRQLPTTMLFDYPTIGALSIFLERELFPDESAHQTPAETDELLETLTELSDEDAEALLLKELSLHDEDRTE